jgi:hypothetical protein
MKPVFTAMWSNRRNYRLRPIYLNIYHYRNDAGRQMFLTDWYCLCSQINVPWSLFHFLNPNPNGRTTWTGDQPAARPLPTYRTAQNKINAQRHPCFEWQSKPRPQYSTGEDSSCLRSRGHCDRLIYHYFHIRVFPFVTGVPMNLNASHCRRADWFNG